MKKKIALSILIACKNEGEKIANTIRYIHKQNYDHKKYEIIVTDDSSMDNSAELARRLGAKVIHSDKNIWMAEARTKGIKECRGEIVIIIDAHLYITNHEAFSIIVKTLSENPSLGGLCGAYRSAKLTDLNQFRDIRREVIFKKNNKRRNISLQEFTTLSFAFAAVRKIVFEQCKMPEDFRETFGEDTFFQLLAHKKGWNFLFLPELTSVHDSEQNLSGIGKKMLYEIRGTANVLMHSAKQQVSVPHLHFFLSYPLTLIVGIIILFLNLKIGLIILMIGILYEIVQSSQCLFLPSYPMSVRLGAIAYLLLKEYTSMVYIPYYLVFTKHISLMEFIQVYKKISFWEIQKWSTV